ncbi:MAG: hypothetical protein EBS34_01000 [Flavobacteriales bacterium]|nr:hypothetical protein [Flavobacteriales bacterium]
MTREILFLKLMLSCLNKTLNGINHTFYKCHERPSSRYSICRIKFGTDNTRAFAYNDTNTTKTGVTKKSGLISEETFLALEKHLAQLIDSLGGCERIKNTPIPYSYSMFF